jgi:TRAP-type transport system periplasmic protein
MRKRSNFVGFVFVLATALSLALAFFMSGVPPAFAAEQPVKLKILASYGVDYKYVPVWLVPYVERLNQRSGGRLQVSWVGPEAIPPFEQLKPLSAGLFDMLYTNAAYHLGEVAVAMGLNLITATPKDRRAAGFYELIDDAYKKVNAKLLGLSCGAAGYHYILKKELAKADFSGLKIRTSPFYDPMMKALGGATVRLAASEIYSSLEKGVVDGTAWPVMGALDYKWYEVTKFQLRPQFGQVNELVLVNVDTWNKLPIDMKNLITKVTMEMEEEGYKNLTEAYKAEESQLISLGLKLNVLPKAEGDKFLKTYYDRTLEETVLKLAPDHGPKLKNLTEQLMQKR